MIATSSFIIIQDNAGKNIKSHLAVEFNEAVWFPGQFFYIYLPICLKLGRHI